MRNLHILDGMEKFEDIKSLKELISILDLKQGDIADAIGMHVNYFNKSLSGARRFKPEESLKLSEHLERFGVDKALTLKLAGTSNLFEAANQAYKKNIDSTMLDAFIEWGRFANSYDLYRKTPPEKMKEKLGHFLKWIGDKNPDDAGSKEVCTFLQGAFYEHIDSTRPQ